MAYQGLLEKLETCDDICVPSLVVEAVNTFIQSSDDDSNITRLLEVSIRRQRLYLSSFLLLSPRTATHVFLFNIPADSLCDKET